MPDILSVVEQSLSRHLAQLDTRRPPDKLVLAYSGGKDSRVLLHILAQVAVKEGWPELEAVHVHHGLSPHADEWADFCIQSTATYTIPCQIFYLQITDSPRVSLEDTARQQRYEQLLAFCKTRNAALVLAQHQDDQLETILLQLKRGAGPKGLAAMGASQQRQGITLLRPMLDVSQHAISEYAEVNNLTWVEDESNTDTRFDRNFLRRKVLPALQARWPGLAKAAGRSAALCAQQDGLLMEVAAERLAVVEDANGTLSVPLLLKYSRQWQSLLIRQWLTNRHCPLPSYAQMGELLNFLGARRDSQPALKLQQHTVRRWQDSLWLTDAAPEIPANVPVPFGRPLALSWLGVTLELNTTTADVQPDIEAKLHTGHLSARIRTESKGRSKLLKDWLKEWGIPPWERQQVGTLYIGNLPVAVCLHQKVIEVAGHSHSINLTWWLAEGKN